MMFTACLALKDARSRKPAVNRALGEVGLDSYRHGRIGGAMFRGLSTGQKRRLSIALELLKNPSILFLDEPLSGLDNYGANEIMKSLTSLARKSELCPIWSNIKFKADIVLSSNICFSDTFDVLHFPTGSFPPTVHKWRGWNNR